jgi:hypothetical protein
MPRTQRAYQSGERVRLRHILFAVTPGVHVVALRKRAEAALIEVRSHDDQDRSTLRRSGADPVELPQWLLWVASSDG